MLEWLLYCAKIPILFPLLQAFGSQFVYCQKKLELDPAKINVNGGAMAMGHPLGATGICYINLHPFTLLCL